MSCHGSARWKNKMKKLCADCFASSLARAIGSGRDPSAERAAVNAVLSVPSASFKASLSPPVLFSKLFELLNRFHVSSSCPTNAGKGSWQCFIQMYMDAS
jgi:hypothetical protein